MIRLAGKLARFRKNGREDLSHAVRNVVVFADPFARETAAERHRG
jgi:hypothetical protein